MTGVLLFAGVDEVTADVRNRARSSDKQVRVAGCQGVGEVVATDTPVVVAIPCLAIEFVLTCITIIKPPPINAFTTTNHQLSSLPSHARSSNSVRRPMYVLYPFQLM